MEYRPSHGAHDAEQVTKQFYAAFTRQRELFRSFLQGIACENEQRWYVSVMLNRLMFSYFLQAKGFLNHDPNYLRERLTWSQANLGADCYYRGFLRLLFFEGFACEPAQRSAATNQVLGRVPYLSGSLFLPHPLEDRYGAALAIPDRAFGQLFDFFSGWRWYLNERPGRSDREIDPAVLGYICEKYINQKQMGAYYTRDDITGYICRNTIIPALCDKAGLDLAPLNLPQHITRYIYPAMRQSEPLPTETERELAARHARVATLVAEAQAGKLATINDAVTANLDLEALLADLIPRLAPPKLYALYAALAGDPRTGQLPLTILDPTVGSGAFLFAALRILKPIYAALLDRMAELIADHEGDVTQRRKGAKNDEANVTQRREGAKEDSEQKNLAPLRLCVKEAMRFREVLAAAAAHPNRDYFITKSIVAHNLYGVDLMAEATEICKLRLFLCLVAELDDARHIAPLPELDRNIRAGNALVGAIHAAELGLPHQAPDPLHWCTAFHHISAAGGFDVIVGNPPYVAYSKVQQAYRIANYQTAASGNLYAFVIERALNLLAQQGRFGMIVPIASVSTDRMKPLQRLYQRYRQWHSHYAVRPGKLFAGVDMNLTITLLQRASAPADVYCTTYYRWSNGAQSDRPWLFERLSYCPWRAIPPHANPLPKLGAPNEIMLLQKMHAHGKKVKDFTTEHGVPIYYHSGGRYWRKALREKLSSHYKPLFVQEQFRPIILTLLNSQLFYWYWISNSNCMDVVSREVLALPVFDLAQAEIAVFSCLEKRLLENYYNNQTKINRRGKIINTDEINIAVGKAKPILDAIDRVLAAHYGFTEEELDFIINYDIKYRMGHDPLR